jgi:hypothetical protein
MKLQRPDPGIDAAKSGLHGKAGIFFNAGLFSKGGGFNPLDLDPYLLFDARTSMIGTLENPTLDLDPSKQDTLDVITATRAGVATYTDFNGNIASAPANTVRVDHALGYPAILVEPSATNLVTYSEDFSQSNWNKSSGGTGVVPAITSNDTIAPDGTQSADKVVFNKGTADDTSNYSILSDSFPSQQNTASLFIKADTHQRIVIRNSSSWVAYDVTTEWTRIEQTDTGGFFQIGLRDGYGIPNVPDTATVYLWGAQVETGSVSTSYIPTSGGNAAARTRAADDLVISGSDFTDFYNDTEGTVYVEAVPQDGINEFPYYFEFSNGSTGNRHHAYRSGASSHFYALNISGTTIFNTGIGSVTLDSLNRISYSYKSNDYLGSSNGATPIPETGAVPTGISQLLIGNSTAPTPRLMTGRIKRLIYWPYHSDSL